MKRYCAGAVFAGLLLAALPSRADGINLLRNADFTQELQSWNLIVPNQRAATFEKADGMAFPRALVVSVTKDLPYNSTAQTAREFGLRNFESSLQQPINAAFRQGDKIALKVWLRGDAGTAITGSVGSTNEAQPCFLQAPFVLSPQWQEFSATGLCPRDFKPEELKLQLNLPKNYYTVLVGAIRLFKGEDSSVTLVSTPAVQPAPKPQVKYQIIVPDPNSRPSGDGSFEIPILNPPSAPSRPTTPLEVPVGKPQAPVASPKPKPLKPTVPAVVAAPPVLKPSNPPASLLDLPVAPRPSDPKYWEAKSPTLQKLPGLAMMGEAMPEDACGILHNSDFAHNKVFGGTIAAFDVFGSWTLPKKSHIIGEIIPVQVGGYTSAMRLTSTPDAADRKAAWAMRILQNKEVPSITSDQVALRVWLRSPDKACIGIRVDLHNQAECSVAVDQTIALTPDWKEFTFRGRASSGHAYKEIWTYFYTGDCPGTVEMTGVCLTVEGVTSVR
jgi:hypothetical protein